ncbi:YbaY family lipoprotein [Pseudomonadota bacterium]
MKYLRLLTILGMAAFLFACDAKEEEVLLTEPAPAISGTISYRERMALSEDAVIEIILQDVSLADAPAIEIARQRITRPGQVPVPFKLRYDPGDIDERMTYSISARITGQGKLLFINDTVTPVLTRGAGNTVDMVLVRVVGSSELPGMELEGMFRYMADAALFRDCRNNKTYPVSMEGQYLELERTYLNSGIEAGSEAMVQLRGRLLERPAMEGNTNEVKLIVDKLHKLVLEKTCAPSTHAELLGTYWRLDELAGEPVTTPGDMKEAHMILAAAESRVHGNAGCNNFFGQFKTQEDKLSFSAVGSTMMACPAAMDTEQAFLAALGKTVRFGISGLFLELYDADGALLARLEAVYL